MDYINEGQMTIAELIKELEKLPQDALVWHEGCDCNGAANSVTYDESDNSVMIGRCN